MMDCNRRQEGRKEGRKRPTRRRSRRRFHDDFPSVSWFYNEEGREEIVNEENGWPGGEIMKRGRKKGKKMEVEEIIRAHVSGMGD